MNDLELDLNRKDFIYLNKVYSINDIIEFCIESIVPDSELIFHSYYSINSLVILIASTKPYHIHRTYHCTKNSIYYSSNLDEWDFYFNNNFKHMIDKRKREKNIDKLLDI